MLPEEWREICSLLEIPFDENENEGEMENLPSDHILPNYTENEDLEEVEDNHLETFGLQELFSDCAPLELLSPHIEDNILENKGDMKIEPIEIYEVAKYSNLQQSLHVKRAETFKIRLICKGVPANGTGKWYIRLMLVRAHEGFTDIPVDTCCKKHQGRGNDELKNHVLRFLKDYKDYRANYVEGYRPSIVFEVPPPEDGKIEVTLPMYFTCTDSCVTSRQMQSESKGLKQKSRDMRLVVTLETRRNFGDALQILQRNSILLWIKAMLYETDLNRKQRRGPQGGLAQKLKRKNKEPEPGTSTSNKKKRKMVKKYQLQWK